MIKVICPNCGVSFNTADTNAGKTGKCSNCGSPFKVPWPSDLVGSTSDPAAAAVPPVASTVSRAGPGGTTVVVNVHAPTPAQAGRIGPAEKSILITVLLWCLPVGGPPYFYLGQTGKGLLCLVLDVFVLWPLIVITCGAGLAVYVPFHLISLADAIIVTDRIRKSSIDPWRCF